MSSQAQASPALLGVGILGAGPVTQAIHLPSLARLGDILEVRHIMDVDPAVAESVAGRVGARFSTSMDELLADPAVDIVAICSPHQFHAAQVIAACRAGKKAVLCEKPFAMNGEEAAAISAVSAETGVPINVGAMHTFDPGWLAAEDAWGDLPEQVHTVRSSIVLPPNPRFEDFATEIVGRDDFRLCRRLGQARMKPIRSKSKTGDPSRTRTCNPRSRNPLLYPVELWDRLEAGSGRPRLPPAGLLSRQI